METQTWMDRTGWAPGPWDAEPDRAVWTNAATGLPCLARRSPSMGSWCGYVAVPRGHPAHGKGYDEFLLEDITVHGGLTYAAACDDDPVQGICHTAESGGADAVWWFGFDAGHAFDCSPGFDGSWGHVVRETFRWLEEEGHYWTLAEIQQECAHLAAQLAAMGQKSA